MRDDHHLLELKENRILDRIAGFFAEKPGCPGCGYGPPAGLWAVVESERDVQRLTTLFSVSCAKCKAVATYEATREAIEDGGGSLAPTIATRLHDLLENFSGRAKPGVWVTRGLQQQWPTFDHARPKSRDELVHEARQSMWA